MPPAVSIAIPTFNRCASLERAVRSALDQTHGDLEVVVSDNASQDGTRELLTRLGRDDPRLRTVRQPSNRGMVANLNAALALAEGEHVMLLADDDWLAPRAVEVMRAALREQPALAAALGRVTYLRDAAPVDAGQVRALLADDADQRVRDYLAAVTEDHGNTWLYALMPRVLVQGLPPLRNVLGFDWLRVAELAFIGPIALVDEPLIFRQLGGTSASTARNVRESRLPRMHAKIPHLVIARQILADIGWRSPVYAPLGRRGRLTLAVASAMAVPRRNLRHVLYHLAPAALQRRRNARI